MISAQIESELKAWGSAAQELGVWVLLGSGSIDAGNGNNQVFGGLENDIITAGVGNDFLSGDDGNDASAIADYFAPLNVWLQEQNRGHQCGWSAA